MTKRIFFDASILIDLVNAGNELYEETLFLFDHFLRNKSQFYCSPTSFANTCFFLNKKIKNVQKLNQASRKVFSGFIFTREDSIIIDKVMKSDFMDLEDALQYYSAIDSDVNIIITKNFFDLKKSSIPVYHPSQYINEFLI
ncbi:MAG: PIN domain-containing protein [Ginsengibacter sp.]